MRRNMIVTLVSNYGDKKEIARHDNGEPFTITEIDPISNIDWHIRVSAGEIECYPYKDGIPYQGLVPNIKIYAPKNHVHLHAMNSVELDVDSSPTLVCNVAGCSMRLERGNAAVFVLGSTSLFVSWDFPQFKHPKENSLTKVQ